MASFLILGAGKFGRLALLRLAAQDSLARFLMVDRDFRALEAAQALGVPGLATVTGDTAPYLAAHLKDGVSWDWLIPTVPVHTAYVWLLAGPLAGGDWEPVAVPDELETLAALAVRGPGGELYLSRARHLCPDDCPEPEICPVTGEEREAPLFARLTAASLPGWRTLVLASRYLAPGVGGFPPQRLLDLAEEMAGVRRKALIATACRCHGVVHGLRRKGKGA